MTQKNTHPSSFDGLRDLVSSVPLKTLRAHTLRTINQLQGSPTPDDTNEELRVLTRFFSTLTRPPTLHCVRCHDEYFAIENDRYACTMGHDTLCVTLRRASERGYGEYDAFWECYGRTTEG